MKKTKLLLISLLLTDFVMLLQPENAWAGDVQITCDLRVLELTSQQRNQNSFASPTIQNQTASNE